MVSNVLKKEINPMTAEIPIIKPAAISIPKVTTLTYCSRNDSKYCPRTSIPPHSPCDAKSHAVEAAANNGNNNATIIMLLVWDDYNTYTLIFGFWAFNVYIHIQFL
jgi:hypothetical protein